MDLNEITSIKIPEEDQLTVYQLHLIRDSTLGKTFSDACFEMMDLAFKLGYKKGREAAEKEKNRPACANRMDG